MGRRELVALLNLSFWCLVMVERLFLAVPRVCLRFVIVVFPDHTHLLFLNKTHRLSSARMFVRLYRLLLIHCIYVSVTKPTCPAFSAWLNTGSIRSLKVRGKAIMLCSMALPSKLCAALANLMLVHCVIASHAVVSDLSVLVEILSGVDSDHGTDPRGNNSVNSRSTLCPIERRLF